MYPPIDSGRILKECIVKRQEWFLARELIGIAGLPNTLQGIHKRARLQSWKRRTRLGIKGGILEYHYSSLPIEVQKELGLVEVKNLADVDDETWGWFGGAIYTETELISNEEEFEELKIERALEGLENRRIADEIAAYEELERQCTLDEAAYEELERQHTLDETEYEKLITEQMSQLEEFKNSHSFLDIETLNQQERQLLDNFRRLPYKGKGMIISQIIQLLSLLKNSDKSK